MRAIAKYQIRTVKATEAVPQLLQSVFIEGKQFMFEVDTGAGDNFCSEDVWCDLGKPSLSPDTGRYEVANGQPLPTLGIFSTVVTLQGEESSGGKTVEFTVTKVPQLNLLGRDAIVRLRVNISALMDLSPRVDKVDTSTIRPIFSVILSQIKPFRRPASISVRSSLTCLNQNWVALRISNWK